MNFFMIRTQLLPLLPLFLFHTVILEVDAVGSQPIGLHNGSYRRAPYSKVCAAGHCQEQPTSLKELQTVRSMSTKGFEQLHKLHCFLPDKATASLHLIPLVSLP